MTALQFANANSFSTWAMKHLSITEDEQGNVIVSVPDKCGTWFRVTCQESKTNIVPVTCSCGKHECSHQLVVRSFYARIYKQPVATPVVEVAPVKDTSVLHSQPQTSELPGWLAILPSSKERLQRFRALAS